MKADFRLSFVLWIISNVIRICDSACTWPSAFASSSWRDNTRGTITFTSTTLTGWSTTASGQTITNWECLDDSYYTTDSILLIKSTDTANVLGRDYNAYLCLHLTKVTDNSYYYYQIYVQEEKAGQDRVAFSLVTSPLTAKADICASIAVPDAEFHFIVKTGSESAVRQYCPPSLLATMDYVHTDAGGSVTCDTSTDSWDVCTNRTVMTFNYTTCPTQMAESASGEVYCMMTITSTYDYVVVYNTDASPVYRFACFVVNSGGTKAAMVYNNCTDNMTPNTYPKQHDGTVIGALLTMTKSVTCPFGDTSPSTDPGSSSTVPMIVGVIVGLLAIAVAVGVAVYCIKKKKGIAHHDSEKHKLPDGNGNGHVSTIGVTEVDNPALTAQPETNHLTPLSPKHDASVTSPRVLPPITNHV